MADTITLGTAFIFAMNFVLCMIFTALSSSYNEMPICQDKKIGIYLVYGFAIVQVALLINQNLDSGHFFPLFVLTILVGMIITLLVFTGICFSSHIFGILTLVLLIGAACVWVLCWLFSFASFVNKTSCSCLDECNLNCDCSFNQLDGTCEGCCCSRDVEAARSPSVQTAFSTTTSRPIAPPLSTSYPAPIPEATPPPRQNIPSMIEVTRQQLDAMSTSDLKEFMRQNNISDQGVGGRHEMRDLILAIKFSREDSATCGGGGGNTTSTTTTTNNNSGINNAPVMSRLDSRGVATECNICTESMGRGYERNIAIITHCKHVCCTECIERIMVEGNSKCPMCARTFTSNDIIIARDVRGGVFS